jgi:ubiquitin C-terminal hydrolase
MGKEDRLKKQDNAEQEDIVEDLEKNDDSKDKKEDEDENVEPGIEDCFEYKLAGVTVHSGTAHAGHYWAYINTNRGADGPSDDADDNIWGSTENDRWMEFNDSMVRDF